MSNANAEAWGLDKVVDFFDSHRASTTEVYNSEWHFLKDRLKDGMTILDVGCAQGGFASVASEHIKDFRYTGIDINARMIALARERHPQHRFHHVAEGDFSVLGDKRFDLVLVLGILHLHESWRRTIAQAWTHTGGALLLDLRESEFPTIEDKTRSHFRMDFNGGDERHTGTVLPYNIINSAEAQETVLTTCRGARSLLHYGYSHAVSGAAMTPIPTVTTNAYLVER